MEAETDDLDRRIWLLTNRVVVLEELVEILLGKAISDNGATWLRLDDLIVENATLSPQHAGDAFKEALHRDMLEVLRDRYRGAHQESGHFPRLWRRARRTRT